MTTAVETMCAAAVADWGTSSLRVWLLDEQGNALARTTSADGADGLKPDEFEPVLCAALAGLGAAWPPGVALPVVICGMAGARNGWREARYLPVPAALEEIAGQAVKAAASGLDIRILPGLAQPDPRRPDVMRGEETQLLGLVAAEPGFTGIACLPGTHSKWVRLEQGRVRDFHTAMTGELFALLSQRSVLRHVIGTEGTFAPDAPAFAAGLAAGRARPERLLLDLFGIRAAGLLAGQTGAEAAAGLSGLLMGAETAAALADVPEDTPLALIAAGPQAPLYAQALSQAGRRFRTYDAGALALAGLGVAWRQLFPAPGGKP